MSNTGSLIQLHFHDNIDVLNKLSALNGILYYQGVPVFPSVSKQADNALSIAHDGLYISNRTMLSVVQYDTLSRFYYDRGTLYFNNAIVVQECTDLDIQNMLSEMWQEIDPSVNIDDYIAEDEPGGDAGDATES